MELKDAWCKILSMENSERFTSGQVFSILSDYGFFVNYPMLRLVTKSALSHGIWSIILNNGKDNHALSLLKTKLINDGFSDKVIDKIIQSVCSNVLDEHYDSDNTSKDEDNQRPSSVAQFMGIKLGIDVSDFRKDLISKKKNAIYTGVGLSSSEVRIALEKKAGHNVAWRDDIKVNDSYCYKFDFAGFNDCYATVFCLPFSKLVYKVSVQIGFVWGMPSEDERFIKLKSLFDLKYGKSTKTTIRDNIALRNQSNAYTEYVLSPDFVVSYKIQGIKTLATLVIEYLYTPLKETAIIEIDKKVNELIKFTEQKDLATRNIDMLDI